MKAPLPEHLAEAISGMVETRFGLHYPRERWPDLQAGVRAAASELGFRTSREYAEKLLAADVDTADAHALATHLTIGETYFFREPAVFEALTSAVVPRLAEERRGRAKRLRIWSAGCCTGEEPYSIAIALRRALPNFEDWQITILATDINPRFLHKAAVGIYGDWSFRGVPEETRQTWFRRLANGKYEILPSIRKMVSFSCLNLAEDVYPSLVNNTNAMDLIFCRHVLMYFSAAQQRKAVANLRASLVQSGLLLVSTAETSPTFSPAFVPAEFPSLPLYYRDAAPAARAVDASPSIWLAPGPRAVPAAVAAPAAQPRDHVQEARSLANEGSLAAALAACDLALAEDRLLADRHYLRGVILQEQNDLEGAATALQRALFLDHDFVVAHFTLGHLRLRQGRNGESARCFANARTSLARWSADDILPESDGMTAGRLLALLDSMEEVIA